MATWKGKTRGGLLGHQIFVFILKHFGLSSAYLLLRFVAFYYFIFSRASNKHIYFYFKEILGYPPRRARWSVYLNYYSLGQILIDKVAIYSGMADRFTFNLEDERHLAAISEGGFMISAHIGNWEMAGKKSDRIDKTLHLLMLDEEHQKIRELLESVMKERNIRIIPIKDDLSHLIGIRKVLDQHELLAIHGDRFREGTKTLTAMFMGREAEFPEGPFYLALRMGAPVSFAFAMKAGRRRYHFHATPPKVYPMPAGARISAEHLNPILQDYITSLENMLKLYPEQWFNYYEFWGKR